MKVEILGEAFGLGNATDPTDLQVHSAKKQRAEEQVVQNVALHNDTASVLANRAAEVWKMVHPETVLRARRDSQAKQQLQT